MVIKLGYENRITIPSEIRQQLGLVRNDVLNVSIDGNKIILEKIENDSESDLSDNKCICGNDLGDSNFIINGERVCRDCRDKLKDDLLTHLKYKNHIEKHLNK